jgi:uncharacterized damage-inducible protein DinB
MSSFPDLRGTVLAAWRTTNRTTIFLVEQIPLSLWHQPVPGITHRTPCMIAAHLHNCRLRWINTLGAEHGVSAPTTRVDHRRVSRRELAAALRKSGRGIEAILRLGLENGGWVPPSRRYVWRNLPLDVGHVLTYFVAHEGHHRGQIALVARQIGRRLPRSVADGLWMWSQRSREASRS